MIIISILMWMLMGFCELLASLFIILLQAILRLIFKPKRKGGNSSNVWK